MSSLLPHDEQKQNEQVLLNNQNWDSEGEDDDDSDYTPDRDESDHNELDAESVTSEDEDNQKDEDDCNSSIGGGDSPETPVDTPPTSYRSKRKSSTNESSITVKRTKIEDQEELERKARVDAIWAEMNQKDQDKKKPMIEKQPLDDISSSVNRTSTNTIVSTTDIKNRSPIHSTINTTTVPSNTSVTSQKDQQPLSSTNKPIVTRKKIVRPKSNLSALVSHYNIKVPKMNTLEKSRLDWQGYVDREGIRDDLKYTNKDGYMEKVAFLQRVDDRRLSQLKAGQKATTKR
ncbi:bucentaur or craniofacial development-domain-containing protein [Phascolomyces articulosus]|uniref:SWR1-complex protein 5 n=1 Tax=Phascolomyces articulosus TaxID=60185 RepID=A0AAD5P8P7_9FUNG|nr:bucentaur or craniofacial development-domain-containing protein [Phascolomyces articulosus]